VHLQPLELYSIHVKHKYLEVESRIFCLDDMSNGESLHLTIMLVIARLTFNSVAIGAHCQRRTLSWAHPYALRASEIILHAGHGSEIDIWAVTSSS
jgi:hypothetical protein